MGFFPLFVDITDKNCVVVGGGNTAARKIRKLLLFNARVTVIAPFICNEIAETEVITINKRRFIDEDTESAFLVVGATNDRSVNLRISQICRGKNIPVNIVDDPSLCSFYFPAVVRKAPVTVAVSTDGEAPLLARFLREKIENLIDDNIIETAEKISECRKKLPDIFPDETVRKKILETLLQRCLTGKPPKNTDDFLQEMRDIYDNTDRNTEKPPCNCTDGNGNWRTEK